MHALPKVNKTSEKRVLDIRFIASNQALTNSAPTRDVSGSIPRETESLEVHIITVQITRSRIHLLSGFQRMQVYELHCVGEINLTRTDLPIMVIENGSERQFVGDLAESQIGQTTL